MPKPDIAILHYAAPPTIGGVEITIAAHARLFADKQYPVRVIAGRGEPFDSRVPLAIIPDAGSSSPRVLQVNAELTKGLVTDKFDSLVQDLTAEVGQALKNVSHLIVHNALSLHKNLALTVALKKLVEAGHVRLIAWCHDFAWTDPQYANDIHEGFPWQLLVEPWSDVQYVVVSQARKQELRSLFLRHGGEKVPPEITIVPGGIDPFGFLGVSDRAATWVRDLGLFQAAPLLLLPARVTRRKNIEYAISVTAALCRRGQNAKLVITGPPGPHNPTNAAYLDKLRGMRRTLGVEDAVVFMYEFGEVYGDAMRDLYLLADALLFPSEREGFGIPILEAGLARLPIFCADLAPFRETALENAHYFAPSESPDAVAAVIVDFMEHDSVYQLKQRVLNKYAWERIFVERIEPLLNTTALNTGA